MIVKAPQSFEEHSRKTLRVFMAGSVEKNKPESWQTLIEKEFAESNQVVVFNPVREDWDHTWKQTIDDPKFSEQVYWELDMMQQADLIVMYFLPDAQSPVTLLEFGLQARSGKLVVCCPEGFWRKGNIDIVCERFGIPRANTIADLINIIHSKATAL